MRYSTDIVVIDLEATCPESDEGNNTVERSNIIEIGAVRLDKRSLEIQDQFSELVRPLEYPVTPFIANLTSITPEMVADKETFAAVGQRFLDWYGPRNKAIIAAFGAYYDIPLLRRECDAHNLDFRSSIAGGAYDIRAVATVWLAENHHRYRPITWVIRRSDPPRRVGFPCLDGTVLPDFNKPEKYRQARRTPLRRMSR